jgi:DNA-binding HxlR family transcriptional regulator
MRHDQLAEQNCAIARSTAVVGERWVWVVMREAFMGTRRFEDFQRSLGLARNVLTDKLNALVENGIMQREPYAEHPTRTLYSYRLTDKGKALYPVYLALMVWGNEWTDLPAGSPIQIVHDSCGEVTRPTVTCSECGEELDARHTHGIPGPGLLAYKR